MEKKKNAVKGKNSSIDFCGEHKPREKSGLLGSGGLWGSSVATPGGHNLRGTNHSYVFSLTHTVVWGDGFGLPYPSSCFSFDAGCSKFFADGVSLKSCLFSHCLECKQIATNCKKPKAGRFKPNGFTLQLALSATRFTGSGNISKGNGNA